jgi:hypothetical protein
MSDITGVERLRLEKALRMGGGYVLNFSNRTFAEFVLLSTGIEIYGPTYEREGGSKAKRLRAFWTRESNYTVGKLLGDLFEAWHELGESAPPPEDCISIVNRLKESEPVPDMEVLNPISDEIVFDKLAKSIRESIERNEPEHSLDRLHTYLVKYFRALCNDHGISTERDKPLHSLAGEYIKALRKEGKIESEMTERILRSSISILEAFNDVRNDKSFAHDNPLLNYDESILIHSYVTSSVRFLRAIESKHDEKPGAKK